MRTGTGLREVAERAGVSMRTVSNVVRGTGRFSEATQERVLRAVEELGYRPDTAARRLRTGRSGVLLLAVPELGLLLVSELSSSFEVIPVPDGKISRFRIDGSRPHDE